MPSKGRAGRVPTGTHQAGCAGHRIDWRCGVRLTLKELREGTLQWLDDPNGDQFAAGGNNDRLDRYINEAYQKLVNEV
ncbi:MAG: hypothetical protein ACYTAN_12785, partial [Planctomycetota bacterium]